MLVSAVDQLEAFAAERQYREAASLLEAVNQLSSHFEAFKDMTNSFDQLQYSFLAHEAGNFDGESGAASDEAPSLLGRAGDGLKKN